MIHDCPPKNWKRPAIPKRVKLEVRLKQGGRSPVSGVKLGTDSEVRYDHRPALWERKYDDEANDTIPPANDPNYIDALTIEEHNQRTFGNKATSVGSDLHRKAKGARLRGETKQKKSTMNGSRKSKWKRKMDGTVVRRNDG